MQPQIRSCAIALCVLASPFLLAAQGPARSGEIVVTGTLLGADGVPMPRADVTLQKDAQNSVATVRADSLGRFTLEYHGSDWAWLVLQGAGHQQQLELVYFDRPETVALDARLAAIHGADSVTSVTAFGDFNDFDRHKGRPLTRKANGVWSLEVPTAADTLAYELATQNGTLLLPATDAVRYAKLEMGEYAAVVPAHNGRAIIVFTPRHARQSTDAARLTFRDSTSRTARIAAILSIVGEYSDTAKAVKTAPAFDAGSDADRRAEWQPLAKAMMEQVDSERDPLVRAFDLLTLMELAHDGAFVPARYGERTLREIHPDSPLWTLPNVRTLGLVTASVLVTGQTDSLRVSLKYRPDLVTRFLAVTEALLAAQSDEATRSMLIARAARELFIAGDSDQANVYLGRLVGEYPDAPMTKFAMAQYGGNRVLKVGNSIPTFRLSALGDSAITYTPESMHGKVYLLDFWATWCGPCVAERPLLRKVYEEFHEKGFEILSVSADDARSTVRDFQKTQAMPWLNAIALEGFASPALKQFEIAFLPRSVLVDGNGKIIAVDDELRGAKLERTVAGAFVR